MTKTISEATLEKLKLTVPNPYGKMVRIDRVNMLIERAYQSGQAQALEKIMDTYKEALDDMFSEICKLAEPDERQPGAGDLNTHLDNIFDIRKELLRQRKELNEKINNG